jgi:hypothetical protein
MGIETRAGIGYEKLSWIRDRMTDSRAVAHRAHLPTLNLEL